MKKRISAQAWFERARVELAKFSKSGTEDAARILEAVLQQTSSKLWAHGERQLTISEYISLEALLDKRKQGIPVAYLIGKKAFWELEFQTSPVALVPRPETEHLVFYALELLDPSKQIQLVDLGCGSGCIGLSLAYALSNAEVFCTDQSEMALALAKSNAIRLGLEHCTQFFQGNWYQALEQLKTKLQFDLIVSNPPYLSLTEWQTCEQELKFEPQMALLGGPSGYEAFEKVVLQAPSWLKRNGWLLLEHGWTQAEQVRAYFESARFSNVESLLDYSGKQRLTRGQWIDENEV